MSLLAIRCWLHVIETLNFIRTSVYLIEGQCKRGSVTVKNREGWALKLSIQSQELEDMLAEEKQENEVVKTIGKGK